MPASQPPPPGGRAGHALPLRHAIALGLLQGPTELLPVSSSAHTALVPWLAGRRPRELDPTLRKSFEVALHAGTAAALLVRPPHPRGAERASLLTLAGALAPPALAGYALGGRIERRLGTPVTIAAGLIAGSVAMSVGEVRARARVRVCASACACGACAGGACREVQARARVRVCASACACGACTGGACGEVQARARACVGGACVGGARVRACARARPAADATIEDGLALGGAQALALIPGVSRSGASLAAARLRGFSRASADRLSWQAGLPVMAGASLLQSSRLARSGAAREIRAPLAAGAAAAFASTLIARGALSAERRAALTLPCALYRVALAALVIRRARREAASNPTPIPKK